MHSELRRQGCLDCTLEPRKRAAYAINCQTAEGRRLTARSSNPLFCGLALMVFPYFVSNTILLVAIGFTLITLPYFVRL